MVFYKFAMFYKLPFYKNMDKGVLKQIILDNRVEVERYEVFLRNVDMSS